MKKTFIYFILLILSVLVISCSTAKEIIPLSPTFISFYKLVHRYTNKPLPKVDDIHIPFSGSLEFRADGTYTIITYFTNITYSSDKIWTDSKIDIGTYIIYDNNIYMKGYNQITIIARIDGKTITTTVDDIRMVYHRIL